MLPPAIFGVTAKGTINITSSAEPAVVTLLRSGTDSSGRTIIPAAEHRSTLARLAKPYAARIVVANPGQLEFLGAVGQDTEGHLKTVRGSGEPAGPTAMMASATTMPIASPKSGTGGAAVTSLSALHDALYVLRKPSGGAVAELHVFDILRNEWSERPLEGGLLPELPLALTYAAQPDALFALDRSNDPVGTVRLFRIRLDGHVDLLASGIGIGQKARVFLTSNELGYLVLAAARENPPRFHVLEVDAFGPVAKSTRLYKGASALRGPPFVTERALHLLVAGNDGGFQALEVELGKMVKSHGAKVQLPDM